MALLKGQPLPPSFYPIPDDGSSLRSEAASTTIQHRGFILTRCVVHDFMGAVEQILSLANSDEINTGAGARDGTF
jgi:hypothetical protein